MFNFFKGFFGATNSADEGEGSQRREDFLKEDDSFSSQSIFRNDGHMGFNVFSNPVEMHRYFELQLNNILKSFGMPNEDTLFGFSENGPELFSNFLDGPEQQASSEKDLRDHYLKPGFQKPHSRSEDRTDRDLDGKINPADLDSVFTNKSHELKPFENKPKMHTFGQQVITRMFTNHNGIIESQKTVKDNLGNEETTITHKRGNQEYTKVIKVDKDGKKEIKENFLNMSEKDLEKFLGYKNIPRIEVGPTTDSKGPNWFPFEKYFK